MWDRVGVPLSFDPLIHIIPYVACRFKCALVFAQLYISNAISIII